MKSLKGTKTAENLLISFAGEAQARNRYDIYAKVAYEEGYMQIGKIFEETAYNELQHAKRFYNFLIEGFEGDLPASVEINADYPVAKGTTLENLKAGAAGEHEEWAEMYPAFAEVAKEEGFPEISAAFKMISEAEKRHEARYNKLIENVANEKVFEKDEEVYWICEECGYIHKGKKPPKKCPACLASYNYFEVWKETY